MNSNFIGSYLHSLFPYYLMLRIGLLKVEKGLTDYLNCDSDVVAGDKEMFANALEC